MEDKAKEVEEKVQKLGSCSFSSWHYGKGMVKMPAAGLIQSAGFDKGYRKGNVGLSPKHTLIIVAHQGAAALEVIELA